MRPRDRTAVPLGGETASHWDERTTDAINVNTKDNGQTSARATRTAPPVWAVGYPPSGHRRRWLLIVKTCTACRGSHHHYTGPHGARRRRGCGAGSYYLKPRPKLAVV
jgi:hypothetical protein